MVDRESRARLEIMAARRAQVVSDSSGGHAWEMAFRDPPEAFRRYVRQYCGYRETAPAALRRHEFPTPQVVLIFEFGPPLRLVDPADPSRSDRFPGGFTAGMTELPAITEHDGFQAGMEVKLTPIGARLFFDFPMTELANRIVSLPDVLRPSERDVSARLHDAADWDARFDELDQLVAGRIAGARARTRMTDWALSRIEESGGQIDIGTLARELGYSQKHLISLFRDHVGLPPKLVARLVRFDRVMRHVRSGAAGSWAEIAAACGYYDQAHLNREVRRFTGTTPTAAREMLAEAEESFPSPASAG
jgi:AraC-like DNA-binding protein